MPYIAFVIDKKDRDVLLERFKPKYKNITCDHITYKYPVTDLDIIPNDPKNIDILGYHDDGNIEFLVVKVDSNKYQQESNNHYHITISFNDCSKPKDSNDAIAKLDKKSLYNLKSGLKIKAYSKKL